MELSIILPCYNEGRTIKKSVETKLAYLDGLQVEYELIAVIDGIVDATLDELRAVDHKSLRVMFYPKNRGKGFAVRHGMLSAAGKYVGYIDSDLNIDISLIGCMYDTMCKTGSDVVYPNKYRRDSAYKFSFFRKIFSYCYKIFIKALFGFDVHDTQTGAKLYRREVLDKILPRCRVDGFGFEIEMFALAHRCGFRKFTDVPVNIEKNTVSSVRARHVIRILSDTLKIWLR
jgi:glycosyltransferase involved in cell wall biosynthesis